MLVSRTRTSKLPGIMRNRSARRAKESEEKLRDVKRKAGHDIEQLQRNISELQEEIKQGKSVIANKDSQIAKSKVKQEAQRDHNPTQDESNRLRDENEGLRDRLKVEESLWDEAKNRAKDLQGALDRKPVSKERNASVGSTSKLDHMRMLITQFQRDI
ncbi:hypothetical protein K469DRAFT_26939 [Zopfia rhizophila CBS 207.26]|uniref:Uncharacterized protein n=1 Tax=Zopfia rhizophila CBS 207.26 TaxID=1314779 RepID=A0A6A6EEV6_9PEZI|nr:hypothetical protein K469DRAFT_26939 [Zopfia rhizophila CBS 207.26]